MAFELSTPTQTLLAEIADRKMTRKHIAVTYRLAMQSSVKTDWAKVNKAIMERWSPSALKWIKEAAWGERVS